jgi:23S rRNA (guanine745-N1)-methyltransferase
VLLCPVRGCHQELTRDGRRLVCPKHHSFDLARSGYLNLLQPQERRSRQPGDSAAIVKARRHLHDRGITQPLLAAIAEMADLSADDVVLDAGCGEGFYLGELGRRSGCAGHGIDISIPAIDAAARRFPPCEWIVGNADRFIPYADDSFSLILSITARMNAKEFRRVLRDDGRLLVGIPAPDDLIELREKGRDRVAQTVEAFAGPFKPAGQRRITTTVAMDTPSVRDVLVSIYRPIGVRPAEAMRVTLSLDLLLFRPA